MGTLYFAVNRKTHKVCELGKTYIDLQSPKPSTWDEVKTAVNSSQEFSPLLHSDDYENFVVSQLQILGPDPADLEVISDNAPQDEYPNYKIVSSRYTEDREAIGKSLSDYLDF